MAAGRHAVRLIGCPVPSVLLSHLLLDRGRGGDGGHDVVEDDDSERNEGCERWWLWT
jgi:hypothetical protein